MYRQSTKIRTISTSRLTYRRRTLLRMCWTLVKDLGILTAPERGQSNYVASLMFATPMTPLLMATATVTRKSTETAATLVTPDLQTLFVGDYEPAAFQDLCCRVNVSPKIMSDPDFSAFYYSVVTGQWSANAAAQSRIAKDLIALNANKLSIRFTVDGFQSDSTNPDWWHDGDPQVFPICRWLTQSGSSPALNTAYATVHGNSITIDLCNSLRTSRPVTC